MEYVELYEEAELVGGLISQCTMWAASLRMATEFERTPPTTSVAMNKKHTTQALSTL
jgi:hypothetical protein